MKIIDMKMNDLEKVIDVSISKNGKILGMEQRMDKLEVRMDKLEARMDALEARMDALEARMDEMMEIMLNKFNEVMNLMDTLASGIATIQNECLVQPHVMARYGDQLQDHEVRIKALEI